MGINFNTNQILLPGYNAVSSATYPTSYSIACASPNTQTSGTARTVLATIPIPAGQMQVGDVLRITALFVSTNSANAKTAFVSFGGQDFAVQSWTSGAYQVQVNIRSRTTTSQVAASLGAVNNGNQTLTSGVVDQTAAQNVVISAQATTGEYALLMGYNVQMVRATVSSANVTYSTNQIYIPGVNLYDSNNYGTTYSIAETGLQTVLNGTTAETTLASVTIPANLLGPTDALVLNYVVASSSNANTKTYRIKWGGQTVATTAVTLDTMENNYFVLQNGNNTWQSVDSLATGTGATAAYVPTNVDNVLAITGQLSSAADIMNLYQFSVEVWRC